jgi:hypothetical protein
MGLRLHGTERFAMETRPLSRVVAAKECGAAPGRAPERAHRFGARKDVQVHNYAGERELFSELGADRIRTVAVEPGASRAQAQIGLLAEVAAQRGADLTQELAPPHSIYRFETVFAAIRRDGKPNLPLDHRCHALHFVWRKRAGWQSSVTCWPWTRIEETGYETGNVGGRRCRSGIRSHA